MRKVSLISVKVSGSGSNMLNVAQWLALSMSERVKLIVQNSVIFMDAKGDAIPAKEALEAIKAG